METAGHIPISPVRMVGPTLLTTGVAPKIPKLQAVPNVDGPEGTQGTVAVVKLHTTSAANLLPNVSATPVVILAE